MELLYGINKYLLLYLIFINIFAMVLTVYDKWASVNKTKARVRERNLLLVSLLCGALFMYLTMVIIRHKTKHSKFMIAIPLILIFQILLIWKFI